MYYYISENIEEKQRVQVWCSIDGYVEMKTYIFSIFTRYYMAQVNFNFLFLAFATDSEQIIQHFFAIISLFVDPFS